MPIELVVPKVGESITEVMVADWLKQEGDMIARDANVVVLESDKATVELPSPVSGKLTRILKKKGDMAQVGEVIGMMEEMPVDAASSSAPSGEASVSRPAEKTPPAKSPALPAAAANGALAEDAATARVMPAAQRVLAEAGLTAEGVKATGPGGRLLKEDAERHVAAMTSNAAVRGGQAAATQVQALAPATPAPKVAPPTPGNAPAGRGTETVPMSMLRRKVAERLVQAQQTAALLTTFNEIDMGEVMALRQKHQEAFTKKNGIKLGFMSFFVRAVVDGLRLIPQLNAQVRGNDILYHHYCDVGVAVGGGKGLVVPIIRNAESLSFAAIEKTIADYGKRAQANTLGLDELQGGTFTISNGGIYGSLLSTPIVNPPQSGILGMHAIQERPVARDGQVVIRPMMYVALTYDHRLVDGREAVTFLKRVKDCLEDPARLILEV